MIEFVISDADLKKDCNTQIEMIVRALSELYTGNHDLPSGYILQQDNCFREGKNQFMISFMLLLVILGIFRFTMMGFLRPGHSHEDVDQVIGDTTHHISHYEFDNPDQLVDITQSLGSRAAPTPKRSKSAPHRSVHAYKLDECSDWKTWGLRTGISTHGIRY